MAVTFTQALNTRPVHPYQWTIAAVCMLVLVADGMDMQLLGIVAPLVMKDFGVDRATFGWAMSSALVGFGLGSWGGGVLGDRIGRRWTLAIAAVLFSLATVGAGSSADVWQLSGWRLLGGLGFGAAYSNALALASEWLPERWRSVVVSTLSVGTPIGGTVVGWIGPQLAAEHGWSGTFVRIGLATILLVLVIAAVLRDSPSFLLARGRQAAAQQQAARVMADVPELLAEQHEAEGAALIGVLHRSNARLNIGIGLAFAAAALVAYGILNWSTTMLTAKGFSLQAAGNAVALAGITSMIGSVAAGLLVRRFGSRRVMASFSAILVLLLVALAFAVETLPAVPDAGEQRLVTGLIGAAGGFFSASIAAMYVMMALGYPQSCRSAGIGFGIFMSRLGAVAASGLGGALLQAGGTSTVPFFAVLTVAAVLISAAALVVDRHVPPAAKVHG
ncbi:MAG: hypothetical protein RLZZ08_906 [Pseudomonadota bacterium]|jgi:AAHS family 4-hydroxybenzoate transporter-like MFS transporter